MAQMRPSVSAKRAMFQSLHEAGCFVMTNPWNVTHSAAPAPWGYRDRGGIGALVTGAHNAVAAQSAGSNRPNTALRMHGIELASSRTLPTQLLSWRGDSIAWKRGSMRNGSMSGSVF